MLLPNFEQEQIRDWILDNGDLFRFEKRDVAKVWNDADSGFTFYKLVFTDGGICEKVVVFDGNLRVGYVTWNDSQLCGLYVMPNYRNKGVAKKLLSYVPTGLHIWIMDFTLTKSEPRGLGYDRLHQFYQVHYYQKENHGIHRNQH
jgi:GNAT superfamily N-acetyltransferase